MNTPVKNPKEKKGLSNKYPQQIITKCPQQKKPTMVQTKG